ncbi:RNA polymerase sigma factor [Pedobacter steynii]|uniref:RNA polymerase subunit sigma-24 n=1 Tax=Pedobacter steynii TaxID=430522 RepID=A0A1D7QEG3_9SPHI|nr:sigma-70 family RNA polymerase sigma factor [Pedobacter steynii]AOM77005.1 RNA polymerase subunit sigma-24 [Pedobacter steynii]
MSYPNESSKTDRQLVENILNGDTHAFGILIKNTEGLVSQMVFKMIISPADRKDIAQDVYLKVFKNLSGFRFQSKLSTWIGQITYNRCLQYLEKKKVVLMDNFNDEDRDLSDKFQQKEIIAERNETEKIMQGKDLSGILAAELDKLTPIYKTMISLYHQEDLSYHEIAEITSLPEGTVKSYLFRARKQLKENILSRYKREEL